jgi:hypothetical protein
MRSSVGQVAVTQTSFEDAPVTVTAQVTTSGYKGRPLVASLLDESGTSVEKQTISAEADGEPISVRFRVKPQQGGVSFYRVAVAPEGKAAQATTQRATDTDEATLANNTRLVAVDRGRGPYPVLYVQHAVRSAAGPTGNSSSSGARSRTTRRYTSSD